MKPTRNLFIRSVGKRTLPTLAVMIFALSASPATADIFTWTQTTGGTYDWATGPNWLGGLSPTPGSGDTVDFSAGNILGDMTLTLDGDRTASIWKFGDTTGTQTWTINAGTPTGKLVLAGASATISVLQNTATINAVVDGTDGLIKSGAGTLILTGANTYTGTTTINRGTLIADTASNATVLNTGSALAFSGTGTFQLKGLSGQSRSQILNGLTLTTGAATIDANNTGTSTTLDLRGTGGTLGITRSTGTTVDFKASGGTFGSDAVVMTAQANDVNTGLIGAWATVNGGADWAVNNGSDVVTAYTGYSDLAGAGPSLASSQYTNYRVTSGSTGNVTMAATGTIDLNTLRINDVANRTIDVRNGTTQGILRFGPVGGILTSGGSHIIGVAGAGNMGTITAGGSTINTAGELVVNNASTLTINSVIANNGSGAVALTKSGAGTMTLTGTNTHTGGTTLNAGTLSFTSSANLGTGTLTINGGTLKAGGNPTLSGMPIVMNGDWTHQGDNSGAGLNTGSGPITLNAPIRITNTNSALTLGGLITNPGGTYNALDISFVKTDSQGWSVTLSAPILLRGDQAANNWAYGTGGSGSAPNITYNGGISDGGNGYSMTFPSGSYNLAGGNSFSGPLVIPSGTTVGLYTGNGTTVGSIRPSSITVNSGGILNFSSRDLGAAGRIETSTNLINNGSVTMSDNSNGMVQGINFGVLSGSGTYSFGGTSGGHSKSIVLNAQNDFTSAITVAKIDGGTLQFTTIKNVSGGASALGAPTSSAAGTIDLAGQTIEYIGVGGITTGKTDRLINMGTGITSGGVSASGATTLSSPFEITSNFSPTSVSAKTLTLGGTGVGKWSGTINNTTLATAVTKSGTGTWILSGNNAYTGVTNVSAGTLSLASIDVVANPNPLGQSTAVAANLLLGNGATLRYTGGTASTDRNFTINGTATGHSATLDASGTGAISFTNTASPAYGTANQTRTLILTGTNTDANILAASIGNNTQAVSLTKNGPGKWVLIGTNTYTGATTVNAGTLALDFSASGAPVTNIINNSANSSALTLGGGTLSLIGKASTSNSQQFNGLTLTAGTSSSVVLTADVTANPLLLTLGAITARNAGSTVDFTLPIGGQDGTNGVTTSSTTFLNNNVLASAANGTAFATVGGADWATLTGSNIVAYSGYTTTTFAGTTNTNYASANIDVNSSEGLLSAAITPNTFRFNSNAANTVTLATGTNTIGAGGILVTSNVDSNLSTITGGTLQGSTTGKDLVVIQNNTGGGLTIESIIANNSTATTLTKAGAGLLTLSGSSANTFSGVTYVSGGTLALNKLNGITGTQAIAGGGLTIGMPANPAAPLVQYAASTTNPDMMGTGTVTINSFGQLDFNGATDTIGNVAIVATGATGATTPIINTAGTGNLTIGTLGITPIDGFTSQINTGTGKLTLGGTLTFTAASTGQARVSGNLDLGNAGRTFTVNPGTGTASAITGLNESYDLLVDAVISGAAGSGLTKNGTGVLKLSGTNSFSGGTTLSQGTLNLNNDNNLGTGVLSLGGGTLQFAAGSSVTVAAGRPVLLSAATSTNVDTSLANGTIASVISGTGNLTKINIGTLTLSNANPFTGNLTVSGGTVIMANAKALQNATFVTTGSGGGVGLDVTGYTTPTLGGLSGAVDLAAAVAGGYSSVTDLTLNLISANQTYSGVIGNGATGMSLTKTGAFTQTLSGANSYTGATAINAGILAINGNQSLATGAVNVNNSALLGGTGILGGAVTLADSSGINLTSDAATGTLTLAGLAISGTAGKNSLAFDLGNATSVTDKIVVSGAVTASSSPASIWLNQLSQSTGARVNAGTYDLLTAGSGTLTLADYNLATTKAFGQTFSLALDGATSTKLQLTSTQVTAATAAAFWAGSTDANWSTATNWNTTVGDNVNTVGAPDYRTNVTFATTTPVPGQLTDNQVDVDFDINSLTFNSASGGVTIGGTKTLTIEATNANGNTAGNGIIASALTAGTNTISANVGLAATQTWNVGTGGTLTVSGSVTDLSGGSYTLKKIGGGTLNLNGTTNLGSLFVGVNVGTNGGGTLAVSSGGTLNVGIGASSSVGVGVNSSGAGSTNMGTLDVSAGDFNANVGSFFVGVCAASGFGTAQTGSGGYLKLGDSNISATNFAIGGTVPDGNSGSGNGGQVTIASGKTANIITPVMSIGTSKAIGLTSYLKLLGTNATLNLGDSSNRTLLTIGSNTSGDMQNKTWSGDMDLSAGTGNVYLSGLTLGINGFGGANANITGTMELNGSSNPSGNVFDVSGGGMPVKIGYGNLSSGYTTTGTLTLANLATGSAVTATDNSTAIVVAYQNGTNVTGNLNLNGGTLTITTTGSAIAGGGGTSNLVLGNASGQGTGMTLKAGASSTTWIQNLTSAKIKTTGVTFDTNSYNITVPQALLTDPTDTGGGLTKTGNGTLTLTNANTYTGDTTVSVGTLLVNNTTGSGTGTGAVNVSTVAILGGNGTIGGSTTISGDHTPGLSAGIQTFTNSLAYAATSNLKWELNDDVSAATTGIRGTDFDGVDVTGGTFAITTGATIDLSFGGAVNFLDSFWGINRNWLVADLGAGVTGDGGSDLFTIGSITGGTNYSGSLGSFTVTRPTDVNGKNDVQLNWTAGVVMTPFESWMAANYPGIPDADNDPDDDPDKDGANNLAEFAFSGNPLDGADRGEIHGLNADSGDVGTDKEMILTVAVRNGVAFSTPGSPAVSDAVVDGLTYKIHGSNNLDSWAVTVNPVTAITAGLPSLPTGYQYVSFSLNGSDGLPGKGFLRAEVSQP